MSYRYLVIPETSTSGASVGVGVTVGIGVLVGSGTQSPLTVILTESDDGSKSVNIGEQKYT